MGQLIFRLLDSLVPAVLEAVEQGARSFPPCNLRARTLKGACWDVASGSLRGDRPPRSAWRFPTYSAPPCEAASFPARACPLSWAAHAVSRPFLLA